MRRAVSVLAAVLLAAGCSEGSGFGDLGRTSATGGGGAPVGGSSGTAAQRSAYGYGASTSGVDYQPAVVVVGGGPGGIRSVSDDGLTWTIDRSAPNAQRLQLGKIMLMTSVAAGRVVALRDEGADRVVTIAPVELTDILRNGSIDVSQALDSSKFVFQPVPGLAVEATAPRPGDLPTPAHSFRAAAMARTNLAVAGTLPPPVSISSSIPAGKFKITPSFDTNGKIGVNIEHTGDSGLKLGVALAFTTSNLSVTGGLSISNGSMRKASLRIDGVTGFAVAISAGTKNGSEDNGKVTVAVPGEFKYPIPPSPATAGLPLTITVKYKVSIATALTGKNSVLLGTGSYGLKGPIGFDGLKTLIPGFSVEKSLINSVQGITLGPSGIVLAFNFKTQVGIGPPILNAGPNDSLTVAVGVTNGSALGANLARCVSATLDLDVGFGVSINVDPTLIAILDRLLPKGTKLDVGVETRKNILHRSQIVPNVPLCGGSR